MNALQQSLQQQAQTTYLQLQAVRQNKRALDQAIQSATIALQFTKREWNLAPKPVAMYSMPNKAYSMSKRKKSSISKMSLF